MTQACPWYQGIAVNDRRCEINQRNGGSLCSTCKFINQSEEGEKMADLNEGKPKCKGWPEGEPCDRAVKGQTGLCRAHYSKRYRDLKKQGQAGGQGSRAAITRRPPVQPAVPDPRPPTVKPKPEQIDLGGILSRTKRVIFELGD